jgi:hypothetical protein
MPASADSSQKLNHDAIAMASFFQRTARPVEPLAVGFAEQFTIASVIFSSGHRRHAKNFGALVVLAPQGAGDHRS